MAAQQTFAFLQAEPPASQKTSAPNRLKSNKQDTKNRLTKLIAESPVNDQAPSENTPASEPVADDQQSVLRRLRQKVGCVSTASPKSPQQFSAGNTGIDEMLPSGGLKTDTLTEWISGSNSSSAAALSLIVAAGHLKSTDGPLVVVDANGQFHPPAAMALGIAAERIVLVRPKNHSDLVWAIDQALRCEAVAAVWSEVSAKLDDKDARRFQLAAEIGKTPGLFVRPKTVRGRPSFAEVRFHVDAVTGKMMHDANMLPTFSPETHASRWLQVSLQRCRGAVLGQKTLVQIDDQANILSVSLPQTGRHETAAVHLATQLANPANTRTKPERQQRRA